MRFKFNVQLYGHSISDRMDMEIIKFVYDYEHDKETGETYHWDRGIAP